MTPNQLAHDLRHTLARYRPAPRPPKPGLKRTKRATAIRLAMRRLRAARHKKGLNSIGKPIGKNVKFRNHKYT